MIDRVIPSAEERARILSLESADDPMPACGDNTHLRYKNRRTCTACREVSNWWSRMGVRFNKRGLRLISDPRLEHTYGDDPEPSPCPHGHAKNDANVKICRHCKAYKAWRMRRCNRLARAGIDRVFTDWDRLTDHVGKLFAGGMTGGMIARHAGCSIETVFRIMRPRPRHKLFADVGIAERLLAIPVPARQFQLVANSAGAPRHLVDATGTHRRMQAACWAGYTMRAQAARLGYAPDSAMSWMGSDTVTIDVAARIADLFPQLIARPIKNTFAVGVARRGRYVPARYYSPTNIDDPTYEPFRKISVPCGLSRRLQALAWMAHGPKEVAEFTGEDATDVERWMRKRGTAPMYALHLVDAAFEALTGAHGTNVEAALLAQEEGWAPPLAWHGIDIDDPRHHACRDLPSGERRSQHPLDSQIHWAIAGLVPADELLKEEKVAVVRALHAAGWSDRRKAVWLRWHEDPVKGKDALLAFRLREGIQGPGKTGWGVPSRHEADDGFIVVPAAA
jgi:hypothetical protein